MDLANPAITLGVSVAAILCAAAWVVRNSSAARAREQQATLEAAARAREQQAALEAAARAREQQAALEAAARARELHQAAARITALEERVAKQEMKNSRAALEASEASVRESRAAQYLTELDKTCATQHRLVRKLALDEQRIATMVQKLRATCAELMGAPQQWNVYRKFMDGGASSFSDGGSGDQGAARPAGAAGGYGAGDTRNNARSTDSGTTTEAGSVDLAKLFKPSCSGVFELEGVQSGTRAHLVKKECTSVALCKELDAVRSLLRGNVGGPGVGGARTAGTSLLLGLGAADLCIALSGVRRG